MNDETLDSEEEKEEEYNDDVSLGGFSQRSAISNIHGRKNLTKFELNLQKQIEQNSSP